MCIWPISNNQYVKKIDKNNGLISPGGKVSMKMRSCTLRSSTSKNGWLLS